MINDAAKTSRRKQQINLNQRCTRIQGMTMTIMRVMKTMSMVLSKLITS